MGVPYQIEVLGVCYFSCRGFFGVQALMEHLRYPNAVREVLMSH